jgi:hypothetical protein
VLLLVDEEKKNLSLKQEQDGMLLKQKVRNP